MAVQGAKLGGFRGAKLKEFRDGIFHFLYLIVSSHWEMAAERRR